MLRWYFFNVFLVNRFDARPTRPTCTVSKRLHARGWLSSIAAAGFSVCSTASSLANDWFGSAPADCSGDNALRDSFNTVVPFSWRIEQGKTGPYAVVFYSAIEQIRAAGGEKVIDSKRLGKVEAAGYRNAVSLSATPAVPYFVEVGIDYYSGLAIKSPHWGTLLGLLFSYLINELNEPSARVESFALFVAEGGELQRRWKLLKNERQGFYAAGSQEYTVSLGAEQRRFVTGGCTYPVKVDVLEFRTDEASSNKIIKPREGGLWGVYDIEDNKWDSTILKYISQDEEYYFFSEDAIENGRVVGQNTHKLGFQGGRWQLKRYDASRFVNLSGPLIPH